MDMARTVWKGALSLGLVNVPVGLYTATQDKTIHLNQFQAGTTDRIRYKKVNERTGEEVESRDIVKGFGIGGGEFVILTDEELASAEPERSRLIDITDFVELGEIDPVYYRSTYYLAPEGEAASKAYALLRQVMLETNQVAIGTLVMRNKEYLVAIRPDDEVLKLQTMYFSDEIQSPAKVLPDLPGAVELSDRELSMAKLLLETMSGEWDPSRYHDTHRKKVEALVEEKRLGNDVIEHSTDEAAPVRVVDLMEALSASIEATTGRSPAAGGSNGSNGSASRTPRSAAKRSTAKATPIAKARAASKPAAKAKPASKAAGRKAS
jgi:DNA end-binding protein Ku